MNTFFRACSISRSREERSKGFPAQGKSVRKSGVYTQSAASRPRILRAPPIIKVTPRCALQRDIKQAFTRPLVVCLAGSVLCLTSPAAGAADLSFGAGVWHRSTPYVGQNPDPLLFPWVQYESRRWFISPLDIGFTFLDSKNVGISLVGAIRPAGYEPRDNRELVGMAKRRTSFDAGLHMIAGGTWGMVQAKALADVTDTHGGGELTVSYGVPFSGKDWEISPSIGVYWQSKNLVDYYYGVRAGEARLGRPQYTGRQTTDVFANLEATYRVTTPWSLFGSITYIHIPDTVSRSPIVDGSAEWRGYAGVMYRFYSSTQ